MQKMAKDQSRKSVCNETISLEITFKVPNKDSGLFENLFLNSKADYVWYQSPAEPKTKTDRTNTPFILHVNPKYKRKKPRHFRTFITTKPKYRTSITT